MIKIAFTTYQFESLGVGPAIFAKRLLKEVANVNNVEIILFTHDLDLVSEYSNDNKVVKVQIDNSLVNRNIGILSQGKYYANVISKYHLDASFDIIVCNNVWCIPNIKHAIPDIPCVGFINDDNLAGGKTPYPGIYPKFRHLVLRYFEKRAARISDVTVVNSKFLKSRLSHTYFLDLSHEVSLLYKGIDIESYNFKINRKFESPLAIGFIKSDIERGGFDLLCKALKQISGRNFVVHVVSANVNKGIKIRDSNNLINVEVIFHGKLMGLALREQMSNWDIFCVPSSHEALGVANMEAMAAGIPVVSVAVGGIPEVLDDGKAGYLANEYTAEALAEQIMLCINDPVRRQRTQTIARRRIELHFDSTTMVGKFINICESAIVQFQ